MNDTYERTISGEEAKQGYFLVLKSKLPFFPAIGSSFTLKAGGKSKKAKVEAYHCECQGPDQPHDHYFVRFAGLAKGDHVIVRRSLSDRKSFTVRIEE